MENVVNLNRENTDGEQLWSRSVETHQNQYNSLLNSHCEYHIMYHL